MFKSLITLIKIMDEYSFLEQERVDAERVLHLLQRRIGGYTSLSCPVELQIQWENQLQKVNNINERLRQLEYLYFPSGRIKTIRDLILFYEDHSTEVENLFITEELDNWLSRVLKRKDLSKLAKILRELNNTKTTLQCLELFVRELCKIEGIDPEPRILVKPDSLNLGIVTMGEYREKELTIKAVNRKFVWGLIQLQSANLPGLIVPEEFNIPEDKLIIKLTTLDLNVSDLFNEGQFSRKCEGQIILYPEFSLSEDRLHGPSYKISIQYTIQKPSIKFSQDQLTLGTIQYGKSSPEALLTISCEPKEAKIKGETEASEGIWVDTLKFEGSSIDLKITVNSIYFEASQEYPNQENQTKLIINTNIGRQEIPIRFKTTSGWNIIIRPVAYFSLILAISMGLIRGLLGLSSTRFRHRIWSYPPEIASSHWISLRIPTFVEFIVATFALIMLSAIVIFILKKLSKFSNHSRNV